MSTPTDTALRRSLRRFTLGSGPLKRGSDRIEVIGRLAVVLALLVAPPLAVAATTVTTDRLEARAVAEAADRHPSSAVLLTDAPPARYGDGDGDGDVPLSRVATRATWSLPDGTSREGVVLVGPGTPAGTAVPVWVDDDSGNLTRAPLDRAGVPSSATAMGVLFLIGVPLTTWALHTALCYALDAHRRHRWAREWAAVAPEWGSRL
jgi:hypothetical protein